MLNHFSHVWLFATPPGSSVHGILRQEYWSQLSCPPPGDLPDTGINSISLISPGLAGEFFTTSSTCQSRRYKFTDRGCLAWRILIITLLACEMSQLYGSLSIFWHSLYFRLGWKLTFSSPVATAEFSKFSGILSAALSQHQLQDLKERHWDSITSTSFAHSDVS